MNLQPWQNSPRFNISQNSANWNTFIFKCKSELTISNTLTLNSSSKNALHYNRTNKQPFGQQMLICEGVKCEGPGDNRNATLLSGLPPCWFICKHANNQHTPKGCLPFPSGVMKSVLLLQNCTVKKQRSMTEKASLFPFPLCSIPSYMLKMVSTFQLPINEKSQWSKLRRNGNFLLMLLNITTSLTESKFCFLSRVLHY